MLLCLFFGEKKLRFLMCWVGALFLIVISFSAFFHYSAPLMGTILLLIGLFLIAAPFFIEIIRSFVSTLFEHILDIVRKKIKKSKKEHGMLEQFKKLSAGLKYCIFAPIILAALYLISIANLEYGYYTFVRIISLVALGIFIFMYCTELGSYLNFPNIATTVVLILFNPIAPIELSKTPWIVLDILSAVTMLAIAIYIICLHCYKPAKELEEREYRERREREERERKERQEKELAGIAYWKQVERARQERNAADIAYWNQEKKEQKQQIINKPSPDAEIAAFNLFKKKFEIAFTDPISLAEYLESVRERARQNPTETSSLALSSILVSVNTAIRIFDEEKDYSGNPLILPNRYVLLDFVIYACFGIRAQLCALCGRDFVMEYDEAFLALLPAFFYTHVNIYQSTLNQIINNRLDKYEELIAKHENYRGIEALVDFISKDILGDPMSPKIAIISADTSFRLTVALPSWLDVVAATMTSEIDEAAKNFPRQ